MKNRILYGVLCLLTNHIGVPCFMQGRVKAGILRIFLGIITLGVIAMINFIMGIVLGIKVLKMTDEEFAKKKDTLLLGVPTR